MSEAKFEEASGVSLSGMPATDEVALTPEQALANLRGPDLGVRYYAAWWLGRFQVNTPEVIDALLESLADESDRTLEGGYPLRRNAARALGKLGDPRVVPGLMRCLDCEDFYVREAAVQSLGALGDRSCVPVLMNFLVGGLEVAQPAPGSVRLPQPYNDIVEALGMLGATEAIPLIEPFLNHPFDLVQYAAARAMYELTQNPVYAERLVKALGGDKLALRRSALADLGAIGYLPAAEAIAQTLAENSLKLIALKGVLEREVQTTELPQLSAGAIRVMTLMDELL